jgi:protein-tyrosine phosphatase
MRQLDGFSLWIGTAHDARDIKYVLGLGVKALVDLAQEEPPVRVTRDLIYLRFPLLDSSGNPLWLLRAAVAAIEELVESRVPTLVACGAGMSRSPAIVAIVTSDFQGIEPGDALMELRKHGPIDVSPALWQDLLAVKNEPAAARQLHSMFHPLNHETK